ncbi:hypothetical protein MBLNU457_g0061t1 [Dothideomycetes sp. NU457]
MSRDAIRKLSRTNINLERRNQRLREVIQANGLDNLGAVNANTTSPSETSRNNARRNSSPDPRRHSVRKTSRRASGRSHRMTHAAHEPMPNDRSEERLLALEDDVYRQPGYGRGTAPEAARLKALSDRLQHLERYGDSQGFVSAQFNDRLHAMMEQVRRLQGH